MAIQPPAVPSRSTDLTIRLFPSPFWSTAVSVPVTVDEAPYPPAVGEGLLGVAAGAAASLVLFELPQAVS